jgi:hypothetical protein
MVHQMPLKSAVLPEPSGDQAGTKPWVRAVLAGAADGLKVRWPLAV